MTCLISRKQQKLFLVNYSYTSKCVQGFYQVRVEVDKLQPARCQQSVGNKHAGLLPTTVIHSLFTYYYLLLIILKISVNKSEIERILRREPQTSSTNYRRRKRVKISEVNIYKWNTSSKPLFYEGDRPSAHRDPPVSVLCLCSFGEVRDCAPHAGPFC